MRKIICFKLHPKANLEDAWQTLEQAGFIPLYSSEDPSGEQEIYIEYAATTAKINFPFAKSIQETTLPEIDWDAQWETHGADFKDGYVHIHLEEFNIPKTLRLKPGPGFGDLSHPTTHLVMQMMAPYVHGKTVWDVGSGSGVLSLAAEAMGAHSIHGIDIDPEAVRHAQENAVLNNSKATFGLPGEKQIEGDEIVILMNMIQSEQEVAWKDLRVPSGIHITLISSGLLPEDRENYLKLTKASWHLQLLEERRENGWLGYLLQRPAHNVV